MGKHLTLQQRLTIEKMHRAGEKAGAIAAAAGISVYTVYYELRHKNELGEYDARASQKRYEEALREKGPTRTVAASPRLQQYLYQKLAVEQKSLEETACALASETDPELPKVNRQTICTALKAGDIPGLSWERYRNNCATVQKDGSLYLPKWFLEEQGLKPGDRFSVSAGNGRIVLTKRGGKTRGRRK